MSTTGGSRAPSEEDAANDQLILHGVLLHPLHYHLHRTLKRVEGTNEEGTYTTHFRTLRYLVPSDELANPLVDGPGTGKCAPEEFRGCRSGRRAFL